MVNVETTDQHIAALKERVADLIAENTSLDNLNAALLKALNDDTAHDCNCRKCTTARKVNDELHQGP